MSVDNLTGEPIWDAARVTKEIIEDQWRDVVAGTLLPEDADSSTVDNASDPVFIALQTGDKEDTRKGLTNPGTRTYIVVNSNDTRDQEWSDVGRNTENLHASAYVTFKTPDDRARAEELYRELRYIYKRANNRYTYDKLTEYGWDHIEVTESNPMDDNYGFRQRSFTWRYTALSRETAPELYGEGYLDYNPE